MHVKYGGGKRSSLGHLNLLDRCVGILESYPISDDKGHTMCPYVGESCDLNCRNSYETHYSKGRTFFGISIYTGQICMGCLLSHKMSHDGGICVTLRHF